MDADRGNWVRVKGDKGLYNVVETGYASCRVRRYWPRPELEVTQPYDRLTLLGWQDLGTLEKDIVSRLADPMVALRDQWLGTVFGREPRPPPKKVVTTIDWEEPTLDS
jgi:hypothetical protein